MYIKATVSAAALWVVSMGCRMGFAVWSSYGSGISHITSFSAAHDITGGQAWVTALILMAFGEVVVRLGYDHHPRPAGQRPGYADRSRQQAEMARAALLTSRTAGYRVGIEKGPLMVVASVARTGQAPGEPFEARRLVGPAIMLACGAVSVLDAHGVAAKVAVGALVVGSELCLLLGRRFPVQRAGLLAILACVAAGVAITILAPRGLGEVPALAGTSLLPRYLPAGWVRNLVVGLVSAAFGVSIWVISGSPVGLLAGAGAWALGRPLDRARRLRSRT